MSLIDSLRRDDADDNSNMDVYSNLAQQFPYKMSQGFGIGGAPGRDSYPHPYEAEIRQYKSTDEQLSVPSKQFKYVDFKDVSCAWIDSVSALNELASTLDSVGEFAIDLEQHSYRTFQGFVCLMQISTRGQDYLIDTLELRDHLYILNSSFTNPKIVKVMHGSDCDILWLQRDFSLYLVNLFDTGQASRVLNFPSFSLAYLLKHFCNVDSNKKYQLADWRVRPLPSEMVKYVTKFVFIVF